MEKVLPPIVEDGFLGMNAQTRVPVPMGYVNLAQNFYVKDRVFKPRPGTVQAGSDLVSSNPVQAIIWMKELDSTPHTYAICNGKWFEYSWAGDTWTDNGTLASLGVTCSTTNKVRWTISRGRIVFTDGANDPFMYAPATDTWSTLSNAPVSEAVDYYYDKCFFYKIPGAEGSFEWSDEGDPVNGYLGASQSWEFAQSDAGALMAMKGMNDVLPIFKEGSIAKLQGEADENFKADAVREGISDSEGTPMTDGLQVVDGNLYYFGRDGFGVLQYGVQMRPIDEDSEGKSVLGDILDEYDATEFENGISFFDKQRRTITWLMSFSGASTKYSGLTYSVDEGAWTRFEFPSTKNFLCATSVEDANTGEQLVMLGTAIGEVFIYGDGSVTADDGAAIEYKIRTREYGREAPTITKRMIQADLLINVTSSTLNAELRPVADGVVKTVRSRPIYYDSAGRRRYRRHFNHTGYTVGWEFYLSSATETAEIESAVTLLTSHGNHPTRG